MATSRRTPRNENEANPAAAAETASVRHDLERMTEELEGAVGRDRQGSVPDPAQTERRQLEQVAELLHGLSRMTHQINNPLTSLLGRAQILGLRQDTDPQVLKAVEVIEESGRRVADYVREMANAIHTGRDQILSRLLELGGESPDRD